MTGESFMAKNNLTLNKLYHQLLTDRLPVKTKSELIANFKKNWFFPISAMGLFCLNARINLGYFIGIPIAFLATMLAASQVTSLLDWEKKSPIALRALCFLTAVGICWGERDAFCRGWLMSPKTLWFKERIPMLMEGISILSILAAIVGLCFAYFWVLAFWRRFLKALSDSEIFKAPLRLGSPKSGFLNLYFTHRIVFNSVVH